MSAPPISRLLMLVTLPLYLLDQITKYLVQAYIHPRQQIPVIAGFFDLVHVTNTGAAWGMFHDSNTFFIALSIVALIVIAFLARQSGFGQPVSQLGLSLLVAGILGNLTDRFVHRHVIDFLQFDLHVPGANPWPSFNVADSCICVAVGCFLLSSWQEMRAAGNPAP